MRSPRWRTSKPETTMSTSDPAQLLIAPDTDSRVATPPFHSGTLPAGVLDPEALARMANEFFTALPNSLNVPSSPLPAHALSTDLPAPGSIPATAPAAPPEISLPSDKHFSGLPASVGPASFSPVSAPAQATPPAVPGVVGTVVSDVVTEAPSFFFLQDARPIFSDRHTQPDGPYSRAQPITAFVSQNIPTNAAPVGSDSDWLAKANPPSQPPAAGLPSAPNLGDASPIPTFSFLEELRPLFSYPPTIPGPVPAAPQTDLLTNVALPGLELPHEFERSRDLSELA